AAAAAQGLARLVVRRNDHLCVDDLGPGGELGMAGEDACDVRLVAEEPELELRVPDQRYVSAWDHHFGPVIAPHGVERYDPLSGHACLAWVTNPLERMAKNACFRPCMR